MMKKHIDDCLEMYSDKTLQDLYTEGVGEDSDEMTIMLAYAFGISFLDASHDTDIAYWLAQSEFTEKSKKYLKKIKKVGFEFSTFVLNNTHYDSAQSNKDYVWNFYRQS